MPNPAIVRIAMILPSSWKITVWTDSKSSFDRINHLESHTARIYNEVGSKQLLLLQHINNMRKEPIQLKHIRSHQKDMTLESVGNATADLIAEQARLFSEAERIPTSPFLPSHNFYKGSKGFNTFAELRKYVKETAWSNTKKWENSRSQAFFYKQGYVPEKTVNYFQRMLKGKHMGVLTDVLTRNITRPSYHDEKPVHCLYCKHVRKSHKVHHLTDEHLSWCTTNKHARSAVKEEIIQKAQSEWEPEWKFMNETSEEETKLARGLVNHLQIDTGSTKLKILTEKGWLGHIWPSDLDRLSILFVKSRKLRDLPISQACWEDSLIQFLTKAQCKCDENDRCHKKCRLSDSWSPPNHLQFLARNLIDASAIRYGNILQKSAAIPTVINSHGADRMWGSIHPDSAGCPKSNYYYAPSNHRWKKAVQLAAGHKRDNIIDSSLGVLQLTPEVKRFIKQQKVSIIATIPARAIHLFPSPLTRRPVKKSTSSYEIGIILATAEGKKTDCESELLTYLNILENWKQRFCPSAIIHRHNLIQELSNKAYEDFDLSQDNWNKLIAKRWEWIHSVTGTQGILLTKDVEAIQKLKGSRKYNDMSIHMALKLFRTFAQDWEDKQALIPLHARSWFYLHHHKREKKKQREREIRAAQREEKMKKLQKKAKQIQQRKKLRSILQRKKY
jgi:hypothetical protein